MPEETAEEIANSMSVEVDPDGEDGPLPPIEIEIPIPKDKRFYAGIVVGFLIATALFLGVGTLT
jgi:hypothetical protein